MNNEIRIPREARLRLHGLRDCKVLRGAPNDFGFRWLAERGHVAWVWAGELIDFRLTDDGRALAAMVIK